MPTFSFRVFFLYFSAHKFPNFMTLSPDHLQCPESRDEDPRSSQSPPHSLWKWTRSKLSGTCLNFCGFESDPTSGSQIDFKAISAPRDSGYDGGGDENEGEAEEDSFGIVALKDFYQRETVLSQIEKIVKRMEKSGYLTSTLEKIQSQLWGGDKSGGKLGGIVCLELGSISATDNFNSIHQFSFLICLQKTLQIPLQFQDPLLSPQDKSIISHNFQFSLLPHHPLPNATWHRVTQPTLFYIPATSYDVINDVLRANWRLQDLANVVMITVGFQGTIRDLRVAPLGFYNPSHFGYIKRAARVATERKLNAAHLPYNPALSCFTLHTFPKSKLCGMRADFWDIHKKSSV